MVDTASIHVQTPLPHLMRTIKLTPWLIKPPANDYPAMIAEIVEWSQTARKEGLLALEDKLETVTDPFARKGLQMLASAREPQAIRAKYRELIIEGLLLIAGGENPRFIEEQLSSYVAK